MQALRTPVPSLQHVFPLAGTSFLSLTEVQGRLFDALVRTRWLSCSVGAPDLLENRTADDQTGIRPRVNNQK